MQWLGPHRADTRRQGLWKRRASLLKGQVSPMRNSTYATEVQTIFSALRSPYPVRRRSQRSRPASNACAALSGSIGLDVDGSLSTEHLLGLTAPPANEPPPRYALRARNNALRSASSFSNLPRASGLAASSASQCSESAWRAASFITLYRRRTSPDRSGHSASSARSDAYSSIDSRGSGTTPRSPCFQRTAAP